MKLLEIDETETHFVIKVVASKVVRIVDKTDAAEVRETLVEILAQAPEQKPAEEPEDEEIPEFDEVKDAISGLLKVGQQLINSEEGQKAKKLLERLPKARKHKKSG